MRGKSQAQTQCLTVINLNATVPEDHPLRPLKRHMDAVLKKLSPLFDDLDAGAGAPSIPPEQLLKARRLTALYSVRRERLFCEQPGCNLLWLWFLDRELSEGSFDHRVFAKNYERVRSAVVAKLFLESWQAGKDIVTRHWSSRSTGIGSITTTLNEWRPC